jgi:hypothetical protein
MTLFKNTTDNRLKTLLNEYYHNIYDGTRNDYRAYKWLELIENELIIRGYLINIYKRSIKAFKI